MYTEASTFTSTAKISLERSLVMSSDYQVVFSDGSVGEKGDFPVAVKSVQHIEYPEKYENQVTDPIFNDEVVRNLYGRVMTLLEATTDSYKLDAVKDLFKKEINGWSEAVYTSAREIATGGGSSSNIYTRSLTN